MAIVTSILTGGSNNHQTTSEEANGVYTDFVSEGIVGTIGNTSGVAPATGGFAVNAQGTPDMTVAVSAGVAYVQGTPSSQNAQTFRVKNSASSNVTISANSSGSTKYDWVYISLSATNLNTPNTAGDNVASLTTSRSSSASTDDGTPPTYSYPLAVITVANGASSITNSVIRDIRAASTISNGTSNVSAGWNSLGYSPNTVTYNGNRSYSLTFNSTDLTSTLSNGMRVNTTRTVSAPTQCTSLNGTTQYYNKTSPAGMTFTDDFVASAWVKLTSYGATSVIASRYNGTSGWQFTIEAAGQVQLTGFNAGVANFSYVLSYQSIPLNKWVHVAAQLDMSGYPTVGATNSYVMIDGVDVPAAMARGGTNPTALVQAGNLEIGSRNGGSYFFPGKIAQVAIYSAKVTQANVVATISQGLAGTETSLISAYSFNNSKNDLSSNANNLTANGSAVETNADSPFAQDDDGVPTGTTDYGIVQSCTFSTNTTLVVQVPEGNAIPTSGGVSSMQYSTQKTPFGFPASEARWIIKIAFKATFTQTSPASNTWYNMTTTSGTSGGMKIPIMYGSWFTDYSGYFESAGGASGGIIYATLSTSSSSESDSEATSKIFVGSSVAAGSSFNRGVYISSTSATATPYYLNVKADVAGEGSFSIIGSQAATVIKARPANL